MRTLMSDGDFLNDLFINKCEILPSVKGEDTEPETFLPSASL